LAHVTATDADEGVNGDVTLSAETLATSSGSGLRNFTGLEKYHYKYHLYFNQL